MTGKERVLAALEFNSPDRIPKDIWILPAASLKYGSRLEEICGCYGTDIAAVTGPFDHAYTPEYYQPGRYMDPWGSLWTNVQTGILGQVKTPVFETYDNIGTYVPPVEQFLKEWEENKGETEEKIRKVREEQKFVIGGWVSVFERLQFLRGTQELYCDIAMEEDELFQMIGYTMQFLRVYVEKWLEMDIDAVPFGDDWGSQISLLVSKDCWRKIFKPLYKELIDLIKEAGKKVFFHSDGYIMELYPEFIELGVDAINSQLWCMGVEKVAQKYAGQITFWGEISRQNTLPNGTPEEIQACADFMIEYLYVNGGGLIGQSEINRDVPLENVEAMLRAW